MLSNKELFIMKLYHLTSNSSECLTLFYAFASVCVGGVCACVCVCRAYVKVRDSCVS